ncbi:DUF2512 family protein [Paenibacillus sp. Marseille-P2973]|uniref:DUF2512 family protein n=1 Tax=Paenibacillus TaxID=44249 RepID=UPI001B374E2D|nr:MULTISPECIES: DUF2512 family protein [Paenibacillus]MBQ4900962.1 DUF2512 family protein [Paenibacillus sp. Marseille-P2973]MDN4070509.1 DUF2512 family protein [Paenibacillus vini]
MDKILVKLLGNGVIVVAMMMILSNASFIGSLLTAVALSALAYLFGDLFILPRTNNMIATLTDGVLAFAFIWAISANAAWTLSMGEILSTALVLGIFEYAFHIWLLRDGIRRDSSVRVR